MTLLRSLRSRVIAQMALLLALVFGIALLGVNSIRVAGHVGDGGALAPAREHRPRQRPGLLGVVRDPLGGAVPGPPERATPAADDRGGRLGLRLSAPLSLARVAHHRRPLHRQQDRVQPGADRSGLRHGARPDRPRPARRGAAHGRAGAGPVRYAAGRRARARPGADHPRRRRARTICGGRRPTGAACCGACSSPRCSWVR